MDAIILDGQSLTMEKAIAIAKGSPVTISEEALAKVKKSQQFVHREATNSASVYGINTGFGFFANTRISDTQLRDLQHNILTSHAAGFGPPLSLEQTRLAMALRLNVLLKGLTGVTPALCERLQTLINLGIYPLIPTFGSVGASGDLAPLAHLALPIIGLGQVSYNGKVMSAADALKKEKLQPLQLHEKEGLGLINGTQIMLAVGSLALADAKQFIGKCHIIAALTFEAMRADPSVLEPFIHHARGQVGQITVAEEMLEALVGSYIMRSTHEPMRLQDPYSLRCVPQVHGASLDSLEYAITIVQRELNAATDNPLVLEEDERIVSGGNFHGQPLAMAFDFAAMGIAELGNISERRLEILLNPHMSLLPAFLTPKEGICSGYMAIQYLAASVVNENKLLANPACTDSIPGNVGVEDHVSMGMTSARKLAKIVEQTKIVLAAELVAAVQAVDLRKPGPLGIKTKELYKKLREVVPKLEDDRIVAEDVAGAVPLL